VDFVDVEFGAEVGCTSLVCCWLILVEDEAPPSP
jgi:hypothetical protein